MNVFANYFVNNGEACNVCNRVEGSGAKKKKKEEKKLTPKKNQKNTHTSIVHLFTCEHTTHSFCARFLWRITNKGTNPSTLDTDFRSTTLREAIKPLAAEYQAFLCP
jgi:hypothetical protein